MTTDEERREYLAGLFEERKLTHEEDVELRRITGQHMKHFFFITCKGLQTEITSPRTKESLLNSNTPYPWEADNETILIYGIACAHYGSPELKEHVASLREHVEERA